MTQELVEKLGYVGIFLLLVLGGLGLPVPEEAPIILAAVFSRKGALSAPWAFLASFAGVLAGDFVVYFLGYFYGEKVLSFPITRKFLTRAREAQIKGYFHRHGFKILILGRFAVGFRTAAYLTAGILKLPPLRLFITDLLAASLSTSLMFGMGWVFTRQIEGMFRKFQHWQHWLTLAAAVVIGSIVIYRYYRAMKRAGAPVGPAVPIADVVPLPPDDLSVPSLETTLETVRNAAGTTATATTAPVECDPLTCEPDANRFEDAKLREKRSDDEKTTIDPASNGAKSAPRRVES